LAAAIVQSDMYLAYMQLHIWVRWACKLKEAAAHAASTCLKRCARCMCPPCIQEISFALCMLASSSSQAMFPLFWRALKLEMTWMNA